MIYFTGDTHYNHRNIVRGVSTWIDKTNCRDYDTQEQMNDVIIKNINSIVKEDDTLFHLGDVGFHGAENIYAFRGRIKCKNIHLIIGNHDTDLYANEGLKSLFTSIEFYREINVNGQKIILCHYPLITWNKNHHGSWMLHGHCHGKLQHSIPATLLLKLLKEGRLDEVWALARNEEVPNLCPNGRIFDVGIDTHPKFRPWSITELHEQMKKKFFTPVDNHTEKEKKLK